MAVATAALAAVAAVGNIIGGIRRGVQARRNAKFMRLVLQEQRKINDSLYARKIRQEVGSDLVNAAARGVAQTGTTLDTVFNEAFSLQQQRVIKNKELALSALRAEMEGSQFAQSAFAQGLGGALQSGYTGFKAYQEQKMIEQAQADRGSL